MSATQELIAAALTAEDQLDMRDFGWVQAEELREACARAMVAPAAPDIAEVERLILALDCAAYNAGHAAGSGAEPRGVDTQRTALLDAVRAISAERDALMQKNKALKYSLQLDEELISKIQQIISILANRPEVSNG